MEILTIISLIYLSASVALTTGIGAVITSCWMRHFDSNSIWGYVGRICFWGGTVTNASIVSGMPVEFALVLFPTTISCVMFPIKTQYLASNSLIDIMFSTANLCVLAFVSLFPLMLVYWLNHYTWQALFMASFILPITYNITNLLKHKRLWPKRYGSNLIEFCYGIIIGLSINIAVHNRVEKQFPPIPSSMVLISYHNYIK